MRKLLLSVVVLAALIGGAWYGGESWFATRAREAVAQSPEIVASSVDALRNPTRFGLRLGGVVMGDDESGFTAPSLEIYAPVTAPNTMTIDLPAELGLRIAGQPVAVTLAEGRAEASISPTHGLTLRRAGLSARNVAVDGSPVLRDLSVTARMTHMGSEAPKHAHGAYAVDLSALGLTPVPGLDPMNITGKLRLWLSDLPGKATIEGLVPPPRLLGAQTEGVTLRMGNLSARLIGRIEADAQGFAAGQAAIYTTDAQAFIDMAAETGLLPENAKLLAAAMVKNLGEARLESDAQAATTEEAAGANEMNTHLTTLPVPVEGELRLPLVLRDGEMRIGDIPLGPAPRLQMD